MASIWLECPECNDLFEVPLELTPAEKGWGSDADGNRGIDMPAFFTHDEIPSACPTCKYVFDPDQLYELNSEADDLTKDYIYDA